MNHPASLVGPGQDGSSSTPPSMSGLMHVLLGLRPACRADGGLHIGVSLHQCCGQLNNWTEARGQGRRRVKPDIEESSLTSLFPVVHTPPPLCRAHAAIFFPHVYPSGGVSCLPLLSRLGLSAVDWSWTSVCAIGPSLLCVAPLWALLGIRIFPMSLVTGVQVGLFKGYHHGQAFYRARA